MIFSRLSMVSIITVMTSDTPCISFVDLDMDFICKLFLLTRNGLFPVDSLVLLVLVLFGQDGVKTKQVDESNDT